MSSTSPLRDEPYGLSADAVQLTVAIRATCVIEPFCGLIDVAGNSTDAAGVVMVENSLAAFDSAVSGTPS